MNQPRPEMDRRTLLKLMTTGGAAIPAMSAWPAAGAPLGGVQSDIEAVGFAVPDDAIDDLNRRLQYIRWPHDVPGEPWSYGADRAYLEELMATHDGAEGIRAFLEKREPRWKND